MHSLSEFGANVPAFLAKLWKLVDDPDTNDLISWTEEGSSFCIRDQAQFSRKLLPMYYKHNNMASFIRQLNMYGFHKIVSADAGSLRLDKDEMEFAHQCFLRGHPYLLEHIKRKVGKSQLLTGKLEEGKDGANGGVVVKAEFMNKLLSEVKSMRGRQDTVENRLSSMKQENEALWRELSLLRQKHTKQQTIVNKLIQFLVTLVQPSQRLSKRRYPLMINNVSHSSGKCNGKVIDTNDSLAPSPTGPTIHELDGDAIISDGDLISPDLDPEALPNTITLHVPDSELAEVIDSTGLDSGVLSPDPEVLDNFDPSIIPSSLMNSPSAIFETRAASLMNRVLAAQKVPTHSSATTAAEEGRPRGVVTRLGASGTKGTPVQLKGASTVKKEIVDRQPAGKKELRVLPARSRKRKHMNSKDMSFSDNNDALNDMLKPVDLLAEVGLTDDKSQTSSLLASGALHDSPNDSMGGSVTSPVTSHLVAYPESPIPVINSPVASPSSHCSIPNVAMSSLSGPTITDVTTPLVVQTPTPLTSEQSSPQPSPSGGSPYDMTLACTSQGTSSPGNSSAFKSSALNRCGLSSKDDLDLHVAATDSELGQFKDFLNNCGIQMDANTLLGLFNGDDSFLPEGDGSSFNSKMDSAGNELMYYQPDFMDLEDIWNNQEGRATPPVSPDPMSSQLNTPVMMPASPGFPGPTTYKRRRN